MTQDKAGPATKAAPAKKAPAAMSATRVGVVTSGQC